MQFLYKKWWEEVTQEMSELLFGWQIEWAISDIIFTNGTATFSMACAPICCPSFLLVQVPVNMWRSPSESLYTSCCFSLVVGWRVKSSSHCRRPWFLYAHMVQLKKCILDLWKRHCILFSVSNIDDSKLSCFHNQLWQSNKSWYRTSSNLQLIPELLYSSNAS